MSALVYVAASAPDVGESLVDLFKIKPSPSADAVKPTPDGFLMIDPALRICEYLSIHDWFHVAGDAGNYDRARALFPSDVLAWVQETQPEALESLTKSHGASAEGVLLDRIRKQLDSLGTLDLLRQGVEIAGLTQGVKLMQGTRAAARAWQTENSADLAACVDGSPSRVLLLTAPLSYGHDGYLCSLDQDESAISSGYASSVRVPMETLPLARESKAA